ncbi:hypothetical protein GOODEAATRI_007305 [Goodea atripinnis]|uniref:Pericentrin n=1 Tax=Goodea atripinnis TaxID=208336 RepID=A0ABV0N8R8_9TELE
MEQKTASTLLSLKVAELNALSKELEMTREQFQKLQAEVNRLQQELLKSQDSLDCAERQKHELESQIHSLRENLACMEEAQALFVKQREEEKRKEQQMDEQIKKMEQVLEEELEQFENMMKAKDAEVTEREHERMVSELTAKHNEELEQLRTEVSLELRESMEAAHQAEMHQAQALRVQWETEAETISQRSLSEIHNRLNAAQTELINTQASLAETSNALADARAALPQTQSELQETKATLEELQTSSKEQVQKLEEELKQACADKDAAASKPFSLCLLGHLPELKEQLMARSSQVDDIEHLKTEFNEQKREIKVLHETELENLRKYEDSPTHLGSHIKLGLRRGCNVAPINLKTSSFLRYFEKRLHASEETYKEEIALLQLRLVESALEESVMKTAEDWFREEKAALEQHLVQRYEKSMAELEDKHKAELEHERTTLQNKHSEDMNALSAKHKAQLDSLSACHRDMVIEHENKHKAELVALESALHSKQMEDLRKLEAAFQESSQAQLEALEAELARTHQEERDELEKRMLGNMDTLEATYLKEVQDLISMSSEHKQLMEIQAAEQLSIREELKRELAQVHMEKFKAMAAELSHVHKELRGTSARELDACRRELEEESARQREHFLEEVELLKVQSEERLQDKINQLKGREDTTQLLEQHRLLMKQLDEEAKLKSRLQLELHKAEGRLWLLEGYVAEKAALEESLQQKETREEKLVEELEDLKVKLHKMQGLTAEVDSEQAVEREHERDEFQQEIRRLEAQLRQTVNVDNKAHKVESLQAIIKDKTEDYSSLLEANQQAQRDLAERNEEIDKLAGRIRELEQALLNGADSVRTVSDLEQELHKAKQREQELTQLCSPSWMRRGTVTMTTPVTPPRSLGMPWMLLSKIYIAKSKRASQNVCFVCIFLLKALKVELEDLQSRVEHLQSEITRVRQEKQEEEERLHEVISTLQAELATLGPNLHEVSDSQDGDSINPSPSPSPEPHMEHLQERRGGPNSLKHEISLTHSAASSSLRSHLKALQSQFETAVAEKEGLERLLLSQEEEYRTQGEEFGKRVRAEREKLDEIQGLLRLRDTELEEEKEKRKLSEEERDRLKVKAEEANTIREEKDHLNSVVLYLQKSEQERLREIEALKTKDHEMKLEMEVLREASLTLEKQVQEVRAENVEMAKGVAEGRGRIKTLETVKGELSAEREALRGRECQLQKEIEKLRKEVGSMKVLIQELTVKLREKEISQEEAQKEVLIKDGDLVDLEAENQRMKAELERLQEDVVVQEEELAYQRRELEQLRLRCQQQDIVPHHQNYQIKGIHISHRTFEEVLIVSRDEASLSSPEVLRRLECSEDRIREHIHGSVLDSRLSELSGLNCTGLDPPQEKTSPRVVMEPPHSRTITPDPATQSTHSPGSLSVSDRFSVLDSLDPDKVSSEIFVLFTF